MNLKAKGLFTWTTLVKYILDEADYSDVWNKKEAPFQNISIFCKNLKKQTSKQTWTDS